MCNHEQLLDFLYDELSPPDRVAVERHLQGCSACRREVAELGGTRMALASWSPPDSELGFSIVRKNAPEPRRRAWGFRPAWGLAAAAVLVLATAAAIANLEVRYDDNGFLVRTGWSKAPQDSAAPPPSAVRAATTSEEWKADLQRLDMRLQQLERMGGRPVTAATVEPGDSGADRPAGARMSDAELLRAVRRMIAESDAAQQRELALRVAQVIRDFDSARAGDLARIEQGLRQIQGLTDAELIRHRDTLNHLLRVTQQR